MDGDILTPTGPEISPAPAPEQGPNAPTSPETAPLSPERGAENVPSPERRSDGAPVAAPTPAPVALPADDTTKDDDDTKKKQPIGVTPAEAADVDVIEMQWVNKAKEIIDHTKDDPHAQETQVEQLQRDYLKKRYGKEIKASG